MKYLLLVLILTNTKASESFKPILKTIIWNKAAVDISSNCKDCMAQSKFTSLSKSDVESIRESIFGGRTWGNQVCLKLFKAKVVSAFDKQKNESHYCLFSDTSYISTDEINYLALELIK